MSTENIQNYIPLPPVQNYSSVQQVPACLPTQGMQTTIPVCQPVQNNTNTNFIPRYMPLIQNGQLYPVPVPQQMQQVQPQQQNARGGNVSAVNITINGVNSPGQTPVCQAPVPTYLPYYVPQPAVNIPPQECKKEPVELKPEIKSESSSALVSKNKPENKKPADELTDVSIQQLEKKLNNKDKNERAHAVAELVVKFKEDETRKDDPRLINLLNSALQDDSKPIVYTAMQAIENGYTNGNAITKQRLQAIKDSHDTFGNSETAEELLTKLSDKQLNLETK